MKIAICLSGFLRTWEYTKKSFIEQLLQDQHARNRRRWNDGADGTDCFRRHHVFRHAPLGFCPSLGAGPVFKKNCFRSSMV